MVLSSLAEEKAIVYHTLLRILYSSQFLSHQCCVHSEDIMMLKEMLFNLLSKEDKIVVTNFFFYAVSVMVTEEMVHES